MSKNGSLPVSEQLFRCSELFRKGSEQLCDSDHSTVPVFPLFRGEHRNSVLVRFGTVERLLD